jgi:hypothetical protein
VRNALPYLIGLSMCIMCAVLTWLLDLDRVESMLFAAVAGAATYVIIMCSEDRNR